MRDLVFWTFLGLVFLVYEFLAFIWPSFPELDPFLPLFLGGIFWRLKPISFWGAVLGYGLVVDLFSAKIPGPTVFSYFIALLIFLQFEKKLALKGFWPAMLSLIIVVTLCETLRLFVFPLLFEMRLPEPVFYFVGRVVFSTLLWGLLCWSFCRVSFVRHVFEEPKASRAG